MEKTRIEFEVNNEDLMGEVQDFVNWMAKCPLPKKRIKVISK